MYQNEDGTMRETAILAAVDTGEYDIEISLQELRELADTAEIDTLGVVVQKRSTPDPATAMGIGRLGELAELVRQTEAEMIIFDMELSPAQLRNIEKECDCPVIDRTMLILNIFARHAVTGEGKLQVELAQLRYQLPRLAGKGVQLSRQGGGGAGGGGARRGAGESQLETDKRHLRARIDTLSEQLAEVATRRNMLRSRRKKDRVTTVAIVGYTNVGKSTLLNTLTEAGVLTEDKLFATLDPTSRALTLPDGRQVMLIDTVGLVRRLPHHLVEAFKSTLEEASNADLILNVCDITSNEMQEQLTVTLDLLRSLEAEAIPVVTVLNKC
ncbi:MAG: GTPase HflX, partial [Angelakisella sp.]